VDTISADPPRGQRTSKRKLAAHRDPSPRPPAALGPGSASAASAAQALDSTQTGALVPRLDDLCERWLAQLGLMPRSVEQYRKAVRSFLPVLARKGRGTCRADVIAWRQNLVRRGLRATSVNSYLAALRSFCAWLESQRIHANICAGVKALRAEARLPQVLSPEELRRLFARQPNGSLGHARDYALLNLMARTGARTAEVVGARLRNIERQGEQTLLWLQRKGRSAADKYVVLSDRALEPLRGYLQKRGISLGDEASADRPLFTALTGGDVPLSGRTVRHIWAHWRAAAGIAPRGVHCLRHTAATLALARGANILDVQEMLGHARLETTRRYLRRDRLEHPAEDFVDW